LVDCVVLCDTGSTDETQAEAVRACREFSKPLALLERDWVDWATNYTKLFNSARDLADYVWIADADHEVAAPAEFRFEGLTAEGYRLCRLEGGDWENWYPCLLRSDVDWTYTGARHAIPSGGITERLTGLDIVHRCDGASSQVSDEQRRSRFAADALYFQERLANDPNDSRAAYYLAQSLQDAGKFDQALSAYEHRGAMHGGFDEERYFALLQVARYKRHFYHRAEDVEAAFIAAHECRPHRHEAMVALIKWWTARNDSRAAAMIEKCLATAVSNDRFLVQRSAYQWRPESRN
jgi:glycosyltransferase involved in cell wall biosynthesis